MQATFHWLRIETFVYATEKEDLVQETFANLVGSEEFDTEVSESEHGNKMLILQRIVSKQRDMSAIFSNLGKDMLEHLLEDVENRIDDDCVFYTRLDKQKAVCGEYAVAHHGDVISITGKVASNPAKKEVAVRNFTAFVNSLLSPQPRPSSQEKDQ
jgi:Predicted exosome subunit